MVPVNTWSSDDKWVFYSDGVKLKTTVYTGEWLVFFSEKHYDYVAWACRKAVSLGLTHLAKHSHMHSIRSSEKDSGVSCFKLDCDIVFVDGKPVSKEHSDLLCFLIESGLVGKTKSGDYINIRYKVLSDGKGHHKGKDWNGFSLNDFMKP